MAPRGTYGAPRGPLELLGAPRRPYRLVGALEASNGLSLSSNEFTRKPVEAPNGQDTRKVNRAPCEKETKTPGEGGGRAG